MNIEDTAKKLLKQLEKDNWEIGIEDDYHDFKHIFSIKKDGILGAFKRLDIIFISLVNDKSEIRFMFYADPEEIGAHKRRFGRKVRENNFEILKDFCRDLFKKTSIQMEEYSVSISPKSKHIMTFGHDNYIYPAYEVELIYYTH